MCPGQGARRSGQLRSSRLAGAWKGHLVQVFSLCIPSADGELTASQPIHLWRAAPFQLMSFSSAGIHLLRVSSLFLFLGAKQKESEDGVMALFNFSAGFRTSSFNSYCNKKKSIFYHITCYSCLELKQGGTSLDGWAEGSRFFFPLLPDTM